MIGSIAKLWAMAQEGAANAAQGAANAAQGAANAAQGAANAAQGAAAKAPAGEASGSLPQDAVLHQGNYWMPREGATFTESVDWLFYGILGLTIFCFVAITIAVVYFTWRYRYRKDEQAEESTAHSDALEITWTVIPSIICVFIFIWGWQGFVDLQTPPTNVKTVNVTAAKWNWTFQHEGPLSGEPLAELHLSVGSPVRLAMRSDDVLHSFYVPAFRTKQDVIPYRYTYVWFEPTEPGIYRLFCTEYCGTDHSQMKTVAVVHGRGEQKCDAAPKPGEPPCCFMSPDNLIGEHCSYEQWEGGYLETLLSTKTPAERGEHYYKSLGCGNCHSLDGSGGKGPTFLGVWGTDRDTNVGSVKADENYIRESILAPAAKVRAGFSPIMPTFKGKLKDEQIDWIIEYMKTLK